MQSIYKMNWLIILAAITLAVYAKAQSCDSTYKERDGAVGLQYNSTAASCSDECSTFVRSASNSTIEYLLDIMNNEAFEIDHNETEHSPIAMDKFNNIIKNFTPVCQKYTDVMAHKYFLQDLLFNGAKLNNATVIIKLTSIIINLQGMANSFQNAQMKDGDSCINFTPIQYISIYQLRLQDELIRDTDQLNAMCLLQMRTRGWQDMNE